MLYFKQLHNGNFDNNCCEDINNNDIATNY